MNSDDIQPADTAARGSTVRVAAVLGNATGNAPAAVGPSPARAAGALAAMADLARAGTAVRQIADMFSISPDRLARAEALDRLELETVVSVDAIMAIANADIASWFGILGDDLRLDLALRGVDAAEPGPACSPQAGGAPDATYGVFCEDAWAAKLRASDDVWVEVRLALGKSRLTTLTSELLAYRYDPFHGLRLTETHKVGFYTARAWNRLLMAGTAADLDRLGIFREDARTVVVLCDATGYLAGPALEVIGARESVEPRVPAEPRWLAVSPAAWRRFRERAGEVRTLRDMEGTWPDAPAVLTPAHLRVATRGTGLEATADRLAAARAALAAAYLASAVQAGPGSALRLRFGGARPASCSLGASPTVDDAEAPVPDSRAGDGLAELANWAYAHASPDKLAIARECLGRELPPGGETTLAGLETAAPAALAAAKANFVLYLRGNTEQYFRLRQQALDAVGAYAESVRKAVGDLAGDVVDNVYKTVGLLAGVIIAGLIQPSLSPLVTKIAAALYTLYMVFLLTYLLPARERRYQLETAALDARLAALPELSETERDTLRAQPAAERVYFERYFRRSRAVYLALAACGLVLFMLLLCTPLGAQIAAAPHAPVLQHLAPIASTPAR